MSYRLVVRPEVDADLLGAEAWYEGQRTGLGREFLRAVRETMAVLPKTHSFTASVIAANRYAGLTRARFPIASSSG